MSDLKPCPFCGGAAERWDITGQDDPNEGGSVIQCTVCGASSPVHFKRKENLISSWNDRASNAATPSRSTEAVADWVIDAQQQYRTEMWGNPPTEGRFQPSDAAPPQTEVPDIRAAKLFGCPEITCKHPTWCRAESRCTGPANAAPPHVEPSAAESERWVEVTCVDCWKVFDALVPITATEARMLELARVIIEGGWPITTRALELANLVDQTFGKAPQ